MMTTYDFILIACAAIGIVIFCAIVCWTAIGIILWLKRVIRTNRQYRAYRNQSDPLDPRD
jgi:hypothetical protein